MTCEECRIAALDPNSIPADTVLAQHLRECHECAVFQENWDLLCADLQDLGAEDSAAQAPARVEMRLRHEFRAQHQMLQSRQVRTLARCALVAAALLIGAFGFLYWKRQHGLNLANGGENAPRVNQPGGKEKTPVAGPELGQTLVASNGGQDFTVLPGAMPGIADDSTVVRVQMQRSTLSQLGLTVNEEQAADWIQVDLLVSGDGQAQAVSLPQTAD